MRSATGANSLYFALHCSSETLFIHVTHSSTEGAGGGKIRRCGSRRGSGTVLESWAVASRQSPVAGCERQAERAPGSRVT